MKLFLPHQYRNNRTYIVTTNNRSKDMNKTGKNYKATAVGDVRAKGRVELHNELGLTGSEISINELPRGPACPLSIPTSGMRRCTL